MEYRGFFDKFFCIDKAAKKKKVKLWLKYFLVFKLCTSDHEKVVGSSTLFNMPHYTEAARQ